MSPSVEPRNIAIIGGGIVGCCTAYYLTQHPLYDRCRDVITVFEASAIAAGASGKAGGLVALWGSSPHIEMAGQGGRFLFMPEADQLLPASPSCIVPLSFQLHQELAKQYGGESRWGYRRIHGVRVGIRGHHRRPFVADAGTAIDNGGISSSPPSNRRQLVISNVPPDLDWLNVEWINSCKSIGTPADTAQVNPHAFTTAMAQLAMEAGVKIALGSVTSINTGRGTVSSVTFTRKGSSGADTTTLPVTDVVLCAGPWTRTLYPAVPVVGLRQHSVLLRPSRPLSAYMVFAEVSLPQTSTTEAQNVEPEIFTRPDDTVWVGGGFEGVESLPPTAEDVVADATACSAIVAQVGAISDELFRGKVLAYQTCYLPSLEGDLSGPVLGPTDVQGLWLAAGHSCWGIHNGPATGKIMAEFVYEGLAKSADVSELTLQHLSEN